MKIEVKVVSKEMIKPSFQTPEHLRSYQLSFLDQISPPVYNPMVMFYTLKGTELESKLSNSTTLSLKLKNSLSNVLTLFYPLAGRVKENLFVDCNDEGIPFFEARVNCRLCDLIPNPNPSELNKFIPFPLDDVDDLALGLQLNLFECGGIAIGSCVSHKIADALSSFMFLKSWAEITAQEGVISESSRPQFVSATLFPPKNISGYNPRVGIASNKINSVVTKMYLFDASAIESIRAKYSQGLENQKRPSRVEALSAFIWSRFVSATRSDQDQGQDQRVYSIVHAVNLRTRIDPPLPDNSFGNFYRIAMTFPRIDGDEGESSGGLVKQMREQISSVDKEFVEALRQGTDHLGFITERAQEFLRGEMVSLNFTSLCRFPLYGCDFGWGEPAWVGSPPLTFKNLVVFMDAKLGDGIEAYVNLEEADMAKFQRDDELLAFVSPTDQV